MKLYHFEIESPIHLYQLNDGRFQVMGGGDLTPIMIGYKYILVQKEIAEYFKGLDVERVSYEPAVVWDRKSGIENTEYVNMRVNHHFDTTELGDVDCTGMQFLLFDNRYLFVSAELKDTLEISACQFKFTEGFSCFG